MSAVIKNAAEVILAVIIVLFLAAVGRGQEQAAMPNLKVTPGWAATTNKALVCKANYLVTHPRRVSLATKQKVLKEYGVLSCPSQVCEIDHLIPREIGGADDIRNLWPQMAAGNYKIKLGHRETSTYRIGFREKDEVENWLRKQVCSGKMSITQAQKAIVVNWLKPYEQMQKQKPAQAFGRERNKVKVIDDMNQKKPEGFGSGAYSPQ